MASLCLPLRASSAEVWAGVGVHCTAVGVGTALGGGGGHRPSALMMCDPPIPPPRVCIPKEAFVWEKKNAQNNEK